MSQDKLINSSDSNPLSLVFSFIEKHWYIVLGLVTIIIWWFMASRVNFKLLFTDTILTGGDSASWLQTVHHLKETLLPHGRLFGYSLANFFGFEELQFYFIPPFLLAVVLSLFMPMTIALKISTVAGIFALPVCAFIAMRWITRNVWLAAASSFLMLIFIFNESYTMFGGNYLSTLAGEFCYSHAIAWFMLFFGYLWRMFERKGNPIIAGILLGLVGLNHLFVFMPAFFLPFFFVIIGRFKIKPAGETVTYKKGRKKSNKGRGHKNLQHQRVQPSDKEGETSRSPGSILAQVGLVYLAAILIMAFWFIPFIAKREFAKSIRLVWQFATFKDFFSQSFLLLGIIGFCINWISFALNRSIRKISLLITYFFAVCAFFYFASALLGIPDIRFIPPVLIISLISFVIFLQVVLGILIEQKPVIKQFRPELLLLALAVVTGFVFAVKNIHNLPVWFDWNNSGYEAKPSWPQLQTIRGRSSGTPDDGRLLWEKLPFRDNTDFGSERAFENCYYFTGRPSMEGVHYGSSFMARAVTYLQSEYSENTRDPEYRYRLYSQINPQAWPYRFHQANGRDIIIYSNRMKQYFSTHPDFTLEYDAGVISPRSSTGKSFHVYRYKWFPDSYVEIYEDDKIHVVNDNPAGFEKDFYRFYRDYELIDHPFVPDKFSDSKLKQFSRFESYDKYYDKYYRTADPEAFVAAKQQAPGLVLNEDAGDFHIKFTTMAVGKPHIIKISYSPNFKSRGGEKIYPVSPGYMLIIPGNAEVDIRYRSTVTEIISLLLTLSAIVLLILSLIKPAYFEALKLPFASQIRAGLIVVVALIAAIMLWSSLFGVLRYEKDFVRAQKLYHQDRDAARAWALVSKHGTMKNLDRYDNVFSFDFMVFKATMLHEIYHRDQEALAILDYLEKRYRHVKKIYSVRNVRQKIRNSRYSSESGKQ